MAKAKFQDPQGRHVRIYCSLLGTPAYRVLGFAAKALYLDIRTMITGTNNGNLSAALSDMKHRGWSSSSTLARALYELRAMGFIAVTRAGGLSMGTRVCSLYRVTDLDVFEQPKVGVQATKATHDYKRFENVQAAERALADGVAKLLDGGRKKQAAKKKLPVSIPNPISSEMKPIGPSIAFDSEQGAAPSVRNTNRGI